VAVEATMSNDYGGFKHLSGPVVTPFFERDVWREFEVWWLYEASKGLRLTTPIGGYLQTKSGETQAISAADWMRMSTGPWRPAIALDGDASVVITDIAVGSVLSPGREPGEDEDEDGGEDDGGHVGGGGGGGGDGDGGDGGDGDALRSERVALGRAGLALERARMELELERERAKMAAERSKLELELMAMRLEVERANNARMAAELEAANARIEAAAKAVETPPKPTARKRDRILAALGWRR